MIEVDGLDEVAKALENAPKEIRRKAAKILTATGEKVADTQRAKTRSDRTRAKITVRPGKRGALGGSDEFSVWVGPGWTDPGEPNLPYIEEYGTSRQPPHPYIEGSADPHWPGAVAELADAAGEL